eukprot:scaffold2913_cov181-Ochromonas_danica.AAC.37
MATTKLLCCIILDYSCSPLASCAREWGESSRHFPSSNAMIIARDAQHLAAETAQSNTAYSLPWPNPSLQTN